jgi:hypothetical protein
MIRSRTAIALLSTALSAGCVSASAQKVRLTANKDQVKDCKLLGTVGDSWRDAEKKTRANDIATAAGVSPDTIFVLDVEHGEDQVYTCPATPK